MDKILLQDLKMLCPKCNDKMELKTTEIIESGKITLCKSKESYIFPSSQIGEGICVLFTCVYCAFHLRGILENLRVTIPDNIKWI